MMLPLPKRKSICLQFLFLFHLDSFPIVPSSALHDTEFGNNPPPHPVSATSSSKIAADVTWEFNHGLEGWGQATSTEMKAEVYHMGGEMKVEILAPAPSVNGIADDVHVVTAHLDSPVLNVPIGERETLALRYRFDGPSKFGKIRLRGFHVPDAVDHGFVDWGNELGGEQDGHDHGHGFLDVYFPIVGDGLWHIGYAEIEKGNDVKKMLNGTITQIRLWPGCHRQQNSGSKPSEASIAPMEGNSFHIDWIRLVRAPVINRVTGCAGEKYFHTKSMEDKGAEYNIEAKRSTINDKLHQYQTIWIRRQTDHPYSLTYNCISRGLEKITLEGHNFGLGGINGTGAPAHVYIDGQPCTYVKHDLHFPQQKITCLTPMLRHEYENNNHYLHSFIEVRNGKLTGLTDTSTSLQYAVPPPKPVNISLTNFASR
jgi:hypothetical protein